MKSLNNVEWSQSRFKIIMGFMTSILDFCLRVMDFFLTLMVEICHGSRSCVTAGQVKQSSPGKKALINVNNVNCGRWY